MNFKGKKNCDLRYFWEIVCLPIIGALVLIFFVTYGVNYILNYSKYDFSSDERIAACEDRGGRYSLDYNSFSDMYYEQCKVASYEINDF